MQLIYLLVSLISLCTNIHSLDTKSFHIKMHHVESHRRQLFKKGDFESLHKLKGRLEVKMRSRFNLETTDIQPLIDYSDAEYLGSCINWPTTADVFNPHFCASFCNALCCGSHPIIITDSCWGLKQFDSSLSSTFKATYGFFAIKYGTGWAKGRIGQDIVQFGDAIHQSDILKIPNTKFGIATSVDSFFAGQAIQGICGTPPFINAIEQDLIKPIFTVYLAKKGGNKIDIHGGLIVYGEEYVNNEHCGEIIGYVPITQPPKYWQFYLNAYSLNGVGRNDEGWDFMNLFAATKNQTLRDYYDMEYLGAVSVGTPRQEFNVVMDTVIPKCCPETKNHSKLGEFVDTCDDGRVLFDASNSSTFQPRDGTFAIRYGTGDCSGKIGRDTMAFGGIGDTDALVVKNVLIGRTTILGNFFYGKEIDGILGLGFSSLATAGMTPPFVEAYNQNLLDNFIFTVYMHRNGFKSNVAGGQITFGGLDTINCGDVY
ncbi:Asp-6 [Aphelenchoides bicaudatus]|nr:Asp-6 [Aphelenchoides bicaudatus]